MPQLLDDIRISSESKSPKYLQVSQAVESFVRKNKLDSGFASPQ